MLEDRIDKNERLKEIDIAKGGGILLVMLGHSITLMANPLNTFILSFHMTLFFFLSGMTIREEYSVRVFIKKRVKVLGKAYIISQIIYLLGGVMIDVLWLKNETLGTFNYFKGLDNWFLIVLFMSSIIAFLIIKIKRSSIILLGGIVSILLWFLCNCGTNFLKKYIEQGLLALGFILLGYLAGNTLLRYLKKNKYWLEMVSLLIVGIFFISKMNGPCAMAGNIYGINKWLFVITSLMGISLVLSLACITESKFVAWCGKNSLIIFITHFGMQKVLIAIWQQLGIHNYMDYPYYLIMFMLLLVAETVLVMCFNMTKYIITRKVKMLWYSVII